MQIDGLQAAEGPLQRQQHLSRMELFYQGGLNAPAADTSLCSIVCNGTTCTINNTANGFANGWTIWISGAGTAALNGMRVYTVVNTNSGTIPSTAAAGTYNATSNATSDANLLIGYDCNILRTT